MEKMKNFEKKVKKKYVEIVEEGHLIEHGVLLSWAGSNFTGANINSAAEG